VSRATDGLHMQDIESGLYYSLWSEIPSRGTFHHRDLSALRAYIDVLAKVLGDNHFSVPCTSYSRVGFPASMNRLRGTG